MSFKSIIVATKKLFHVKTHRGNGVHENKPRTLVKIDSIEPSIQRMQNNGVRAEGPACSNDHLILKAPVRTASLRSESRERGHLRLKEDDLLHNAEAGGLEMQNVRALSRCSSLLSVETRKSKIFEMEKLVLSYRRTKDVRYCVEACDALLKLDAENRIAILHGTAALYEWSTPMGVEKAIAFHKKATAWSEKNPHDRFGVFVAAIFPVVEDDYRKAVRSLEKIVEDDPDDLAAWAMMLAIYNEWDALWRESMHIEMILACARKILTLDPKYLFAEALIAASRGEPLRDDFGKILNTAPRLILDFPLHMQDHLVSPS